MRILRGVFAIGLFFFATGYTECDRFSEVKIPSQSSDPPIAFAGVWVGGEYKEEAVGEETFTYVPGTRERFVFYAGGLDGSGVKEVTLTGDWEHYCIGRDDEHMPGYPKRGTLRDVQRQEGKVGDTVSNGVYAGMELSVPRCPEHTDRGQYEITFRATSVDFHGKRVQSPEYRIYWNSWVWW